MLCGLESPPQPHLLRRTQRFVALLSPLTPVLIPDRAALHSPSWEVICRLFLNQLPWPRNTKGPLCHRQQALPGRIRTAAAARVNHRVSRRARILAHGRYGRRYRPVPKLPRQYCLCPERRQNLRSESMSARDLDPKRWASSSLATISWSGIPATGQPAANGALFVMRCAQRYQLQMALGGFFVRGAVTLGPLCITDEIIFGSALIDSYQLEAKASIVPAHHCDRHGVEAGCGAHPLGKRPPEAGRKRFALPRHRRLVVCQLPASRVRADWDELETNRATQGECVNNTFSLPRHDILPKFGWVSRYHNVFCHWHRNTPGYSDQFRIKRVDEESAIERLSNASLD